MSYQVLARKWRPARFSEMVGQEHVLKALTNALDHDRLHHAYLFTGTRGVGKTSLARLFAKSLNCEQGVSSTPCGECSACQDVAGGRFVDLIEVDAASRTKVEDTRELLENVQYAPSQGRFKVYLIDEVHMLSAHSFNALLKTLEEPPPHIKFLLATTDPQKLPVTILSRCLQFNLKRLTPELVLSHLQRVLNAEAVPFEESALWLLARAAEGSMRDALSLTDQALAFGAGSITEAETRDMLGAIDHRLLTVLLDCVVAGDAARLMARIEEMAAFAPDYDQALADLLTLLHRASVTQALPAHAHHYPQDGDWMNRFARSVRAEDMQLFYQIALNGRRDLPVVPSARDGFEMTLLRMMAFRPVAEGEQVEASEMPAEAEPDVCQGSASNAEIEKKKPVERQTPEFEPLSDTDHLSVPEVPVPDSERGDPAPWEPDASQTPPATDPPVSEVDSLPFETSAAGQDASPIMDRVRGSEAQVKSGLDAFDVDASSGNSDRYSLSQLDNEAWLNIVEQLNLTALPKNIANHLTLESIESDTLHFFQRQSSEFYEDAHEREIQSELSRYFGQPVGIAISSGESQLDTPLERRHKIRAQRQREAEQAINEDEVVMRLQERFGATLVPGSIRPRDRNN